MPGRHGQSPAPSGGAARLVLIGGLCCGRRDEREKIFDRFVDFGQAPASEGGGGNNPPPLSITGAPSMTTFILMLHEDPTLFATMAPEKVESVIAEYMAWGAKMETMGRLRGGQKLKDEGGRHMTARNGKLVITDGPYAEAKDVIGGFFMIKAADYAEAEALIADCPHLRYGLIELRETDECGAGDTGL
jgi:hypothetical protein